MKALTPWTRVRSPWAELENLQDRVNRVFGLTTPTFLQDEAMGWMPAVDLKEMDEEYLLTAELPGLEEKDIEVDVDNDVLTLKGEKKTEREETKEGRWHLMERSYGSFERAFTLPRAVNPEAVKAEFTDGILAIHMPKKKEATGRKVEISRKKNG